jgi:ClpP class serine protease
VRQQLIRQIQENRKSKLITYITGDRQPVGAMIAEDAVRPLYDQLLAVGKIERIDLFLYSRGGDVSVPWRIVSMFREFCREFSVISPYKAHSAATLISLGADEIVMGKKSELSPIDPTLTKRAIGGKWEEQTQEVQS